MAMCNTLSKVLRHRVNFDPTNPEHLKAFKMLVLGEEGPTGNIRQHPTLRFNIDNPFDNVRTMMTHKVAEAFLRERGVC